MPQLKRSLTLFDSIMLVSGSMIGSGIFIVSADMTRVLGSPFWVLVCWVLTGLITLFAALSYGELAGMMPNAGGQFIYLKRAYGRLVSFVYGWTVFLVIQTGVIAAVAVAFARYVGVFIPLFDERNVLFETQNFRLSTTQILAVASVIFLTGLNSRGINNGRIMQQVFTGTKIIALLGLILLGFAVGWSSGHWSSNMALPFNGNASAGNNYSESLAAALGVALIGSLFSSDAWNNVTFIAGEVKNPSRNIPLGLLVGVLIVTILYVLANVAYFMLLPALGTPGGATPIERGIAYAVNDRVGSAAMFPVFGEVASLIMAALIVVSTFGCNNGLILAGARLFQSMAIEGLFFKTAARLNKQGVPSKALWMQAAWASVLCVSGSYSSLLDYCTFASLVFYTVTIAALFRLRKTEPLAPRPYKVVGYPVIPALYILITLYICSVLIIYKPQNTVLGLLIMMLGIPAYYFFNKKKHA